MCTNVLDRLPPAPGFALAWSCLIALLTLSVGCDNRDVRSRAVSGSASGAAAGSGALYSDPAAGTVGDAVGQDAAVRVRSRLVATSASGDEADLLLAWQVAASAVPALRQGSRLVVSLDRDGQRTVLSRQRVDPEAPLGELSLTVPAAAGDARLTVGLDGLAGGLIDDLPTWISLTLPSLLRPPETPLDRLSDVRAFLMPDSYTSEVADGRRVHRFSVRVEGDLEAVEGSLEGGERNVAVTGLDRVTSRHFSVRETDHVDIESPLRAVWQNEPVQVYLVMDVSSSIVLAGAADQLLDAVARTRLALAPVAEFDYRVFASEVYRLGSLRDIAFDTAANSGTALYRAIDTALADIEAAPDADTVIIAFTDGRDFASRNFYPALRSHEQVLEHLLARLRNASVARSTHCTACSGEPDGSGHKPRFETLIVSLGGNVDIEALESIADAGGGDLISVFDNDALGEAFAELTAGMRGVYRLEYSSQQLPDDNLLELLVEAGRDPVDPVPLPNRYGLLPGD